MERHGNKDRIAVRLHQRLHIMRHGSRDRDLASVFQANGEAARQLVIGDSRTRPLDAGRRGEAARARSLLRGFQRKAAAAAA